MSTRLAARSVSYRYPGANSRVISEWDAEFNAGQITALTGPSGCGKSTTLYALALMVNLTAGEVHLDGVRVDNLQDAIRSRIRAEQFGFVFQDAALDSTRSVLDNIVEAAIYRGEDPRLLTGRATALLERMRVSVPLRRRPGQLSGGQAQRIAVCRALIGQPRIIFADEPTGNLDPVSASVVLAELRNQASNGTCVILVTHDPKIAATADARIDLPPSPPGKPALTWEGEKMMFL